MMRKFAFLLILGILGESSLANEATALTSNFTVCEDAMAKLLYDDILPPILGW
jgi:hypothetical protein